MAEDAAQKGAEAYKARQLDQAKEFFEIAARLHPREAKHTSNLSAVLYEQGSYARCIQVIWQTWETLDEAYSGAIPLDNAMAMKLVARMLKSFLNSFFDTSPFEDSTFFQTQRHRSKKAIIEAMEAFSLAERPQPGDERIMQMRSLWKQWKDVTAAYRVEGLHHRADYSSQQREAQARLSQLPMFKGSMDPALEYMRLGMDFVRSVAKGADGKIDKTIYLPPTGEPSWTFLIGGSGDGRHALAMLIDVADFVRNIYPEEPGPTPTAFDSVSTHLTLIDIHPATIARSLVIFSLLHDIVSECARSTRQVRAEAYATIFYTFSSMTMPSYCHIRFLESVKRTITRLETGTSHLKVNANSLPSVLKVLWYWAKPLSQSTDTLLRRNVNHGSCVRSASSQSVEKRTLSACRLDFEGHRKDVDFEPPVHPVWHRPFRPEPLPDATQFLPIYYDPASEAAFYDAVGVLLPPGILLGQHPAIERVLLAGKARRQLPDSLAKAARREVEETWIPNPVLFDETSTEHPYFSYDGNWRGALGYPLLPHPFYSCLFSFEQFSEHYVTSSDRHASQTGFAIMSRFFELAANALYTLRKSLVVEFVVGDVLLDVPRLIRGELGERPSQWPGKYSRIWLSNIPDYTQGIMNSLAHLAPHVRSDGLIQLNCMRNQKMFHSLENYTFNYTLLSMEDLPRYLGCNMLYITNGNSYSGSSTILQGPFQPRALNELASREELNAWLTRHFLNTLCCGRPSPGVGQVIEMNNTLVAFFHLLVYLRCSVGFPSHWLGEFVQSLLDDNLVTNAPLFSKVLPIAPASMKNRETSRSVHLSAWQADLQTIVASARLALPFSLTLPPNFPSAGDVQTYKSSVYPSIPNFDWNIHISPFIKAIGMMMFPPSESTRFFDNTTMPKIEGILDDSPNMSRLDAQFFLGPKQINFNTGIVLWRMTRQWYTKMRHERWNMVLFRTDLNVIVSAWSHALTWTESELPSSLKPAIAKEGNRSLLRI